MTCLFSPNWFALVVVGLVVAFGPRAAARTMPMPLPSPSSSPAGPCAAAALPSIAVRPGIGRAPATSGSVCVAPRGAVVVGVGYRDQRTSGVGRQYLAVYPEPVALVGVAKGLELIIEPSLAYSRRTGTSGSGLPPLAGQQDAGFGAQYLLSDRPLLQQAVALVVTLPTGYPVGPSGFTTGLSTYTLSYAVAVNLGDFGLSSSQGVVVASGPNLANVVHRYVAYQPTVNVSYALSPPTTLLLEDQITAPTGPQAPTGNRALLAVQQTLCANVVLDAEYEINLLPAPGFAQHAIGAGLTIRR